MTPHALYIFRSSELYVRNDTTLPDSFPGEFADSVLDTLDVELFGEPSRIILLRGEDGKAAVVTASVSGPGARPEGSGGQWMRLRAILASSEPSLQALSAKATKALGLINWHHTSRFCGRCGSAMEDHPSDCARICPACKTPIYPRISPCVIVAARKNGKILLARHTDRNQDVFACIAGYVEHGESLEECVAREVFEETGIRVTNIRYVGSQGWPFPDQLMAAFEAEWESGEIKVDPREILEARWFDPDHLPNVPQPGTIAWKLIHRAMGHSTPTEAGIG